MRVNKIQVVKAFSLVFYMMRFSLPCKSWNGKWKNILVFW